MKHNLYLRFMTTMTLLLLACSCFIQRGYAQNNSESLSFVDGELLVKFKDNKKVAITRGSDGRYETSSVASVRTRLHKLGTHEVKPLMPLSGRKQATMARVSISGTRMVEDCDLSQLHLVRFDSKSMSVDEAIAQMMALDEVEFAEPNYIVNTSSVEEDPTSYSDPRSTEQWALQAVRLPQAWALGVCNAERPVIAILDTGVDIDHPDLASNIWTNKDETSDELDNDGNFLIDDLHGWNFIDANNDVMDNNGHGTHVAGIAAAVGNNGIGIVGANPEALIMPLRVLNNRGEGSMAQVIAAVDYAIAKGADVINMSFGWNMRNTPSSALYSSMNKAYNRGVILVAAAGNDGKSIQETDASLIPKCIVYPAAFDHVIGVMASDESGNLASFSNLDQKDGDFLRSWPLYETYAPGVKILSTMPNGTYKCLSGTSMAAPMVAGIMSRLLQYKGKECLNDYAFWQDVQMARGDHGLTIDAEKLFLYNDDTRETFIRIDSKVEAQDEDNDGTIDHGETVHIYPGISAIRGHVVDFVFHADPVEPEEYVIEDGDMEDALFIEPDRTMPSHYYDIEVDEVPLEWSINTGGSMMGKVPFVVRLHDDAPDGKEVVIRISANYGGKDYECLARFEVSNSLELSGIIRQDMTIAGKYITAKNLCVMPDVTLTLTEGAKLDIQGVYSNTFLNYGKIVVEKDCEIYLDGRFGLYSGGVCELTDGARASVVAPGSRVNMEISQEHIKGEKTRPITIMYPVYCSSLEYIYFSGEDSWAHVDSLMHIKADGNLSVWSNNSWSNSLIASDITVSGIAKFEDFKNLDNINVDGSAFFIDNVGEGIITNTHVTGNATFSFCELIDHVWIEGNSYFLLDGTTNPADWALNKTETRIVYSDLAKGVYGSYKNMWDDWVRNVESFNGSGGYDGEEFSTDNYRTDATLIVDHCSIGCDDIEGDFEDQYVYYSYLDKNCFCEKIIAMHLHNGAPIDIITTNSNGVVCTDENNNGRDYIEGRVNVTYNSPLETPPSEILVPYYIGSSSLDYINKYKTTERSVWWPDVKVTGFAPGADRPNPNAPGVVWTVKVDGYDAQDDYDEMPTLGIGRHKVDVWFSKPMNKNIVPTLSMGLNSPYIQRPIDEDGVWNDEGTIYTVYFTISTSTNSDGVNHIRIADARDLENVRIITEYRRFKINIQVVDMLSTNLTATAGPGKVYLKWEPDDADFDDLMGYNVYRCYEYEEEYWGYDDQWEWVQMTRTTLSDTVQVNRKLVQPENTEFIDYDVTPGTTYHYLVKACGPEFSETVVSKMVAATPTEAILGDANGDGRISIADCVGIFRYLLKGNTSDMIVSAMDVDGDGNITISDAEKLALQILSR